MRFLIIGAGGVGGTFGARLAAGGHDVIFAQRGPHGQALRDKGLTLHSDAGNLTLGPQKLWDGVSAQDRDVVLIASKLTHVRAAAESLKGKLGPQTLVVPVQNGITAEDWVAAVLGPDCVVSGIARIFAEIEEPGVIRHHGSHATLVFGEVFDEAGAGPSARLDQVVTACKVEGMDAQQSKDMRVDLWTKFIGLTALSATTCFYHADLSGVRAADGGEALIKALVEEAFAVGRAEGVTLADDLAEKIFTNTQKLPPTTKTSMLFDLERGKPLELPWLSGEVARRGKRHGLATPGSDKVLAKLMPFAEGRSQR